MIRRFEEWNWSPLTGAPWLIVGKGPTADRIDELTLSQFNVLTLNDALLAVPSARIAHLIDADVFTRCAAEIAIRASYLLVPDRLHVECKPRLSVEEFVQTNEDARRLADSGRLIAYHKWSRGIEDTRRPPRAIACRFFSSEAALSILGELGVWDVRTIGVDGGTRYARKFAYLQPLENGRPTFDIQTTQLELIAKHYGMVVAPCFAGEGHGPAE